MRKFPILVVLLFSLSLLAHAALAQEGNEPPPEPAPEPEPTPEPTPEPVPEPQPEPPIADAKLVDIFPKQMNVGDNQLNLYIENTGNIPLENVIAVITGDGISTYDTTPIEELQPEQKSYIIARISAKRAGRIVLTVKLLDDSFERTIYVRDAKAEAAEEQQQQEELRTRNRLAAAGALLTNLTTTYDGVEELYYQKKNQGFDISGIDLRDAKAYLRDAQASYAKSDVEQTEASLVLLQSELHDLRSLLANVQKPKRTFGQWIKDNSTFVVTVGYILGIIISLFTIIELVKKNKAALQERLDTRAPTVARHPPAIPHPVAEKAVAPAQKAKAPPVRSKPAPRKQRVIPRKKTTLRKPHRPTRSPEAAKKYKLNKAKPTTHYAVQPADDEL